MKGCFVRLFFGDELLDRREAVIREVALSRKFPQPEPLVFWAMGRENLEIARAAGWDAELLCEEPVLNLTGQIERCPERERGFLPYRTNVFHAKFVAMKAAMERKGYDHAAFLDLDIGLNHGVEFPFDFWSRLARGREIQAGLRTYHGRKCLWRKDGQRTVCWAAVFYLRGLPICDALLEQARETPEWYEQWVMSRVVDRLMGQWSGAEAYRNAGFNFPYLEQRLCFPAEKAVFVPVLDKGFSPHTKNPEAWQQHVKRIEESRCRATGG